MARVRGTGGVDRLIGTEERDYLLGLAGDDVLEGLGGDDQLEGGDGNDTLNGGLGDDVLLGGEGDDDVKDTSGSDVIDLGGGNDEFIASRIDSGGEEHVSIVGGEGNDQVYFGTKRAGSTIIDLGAGADRLFLYDAAYNLTATLGAGRDIVQLYRLHTLRSVAPIITDFEGGASGDALMFIDFLGHAVSGWRGNRNPFGTDGFLRLVQDGADTLLQIDRDGSRRGHTFETLFTFRDLDAATLTATNLEGFSADGREAVGIRLKGGDEQNRVEGTTGPDRMHGGGGYDILNGGVGNDKLAGGTGDDHLVGGAGNDRLSGDAGADVLIDSGGSNFLDGGSGPDLILLNSIVYGGGSGSGTTTILGGEAEDTIIFQDNREGSATIDSGEASDRITIYSVQNGGLRVTTGSGLDRVSLAWDSLNHFLDAVDVTDFSPGDLKDKLDFRDYLTRGSPSWDKSDPFAAGYLRLTEADGATLVEVDRDGPGGAGAFTTLVRLHGVVADALVAFNFDGFDPRAAAPPAIFDAAIGVIG